ncbi:hypothetical protein NMY22_g6204 [Coprinellus aureogranulatus]|nr:hypothetical protein NMY22_g6204 [Coprinellus aureogranulatus]
MVHLRDDSLADSKAPPDISHLICTNYPPNDVEEAVVRREIDVLEPSIKRVRAQLEELEDRLLRCRSIISPIRRVPQEIIGEIFTSMLDTLPQNYETRTGTLLQLTLVCKAWNDEARKSSHWSELRIPIPPRLGVPRYKEIERRCKDLRLLTIEDSGNCICIRTAGQDVCLLKHSVCFQLLSRYSSLQTISLSFSCIQCFEKLIQSIKTRKEARLTWSAIQNLTLRIKAFQQLQQTVELEHYFDLTILPPTLRSLSLFFPTQPRRGGGSFVNLGFPGYPLINVTSLHISLDWGVGFFILSLQRFPNLQSLRLDGKSLKVSSRWEGHLGEIVLPRLHTLDVSMTLSAAAELLPHLVLPALVDIRMGIYKAAELYNKLKYLKAITAGLSSAPMLLSLTVYCISLEGAYRRDDTAGEEAIVDALSAIPSLQHVALEGICINYRHFTELLKRSQAGGRGFLPGIQSIQVIDPIDIRVTEDFDFDSFLQFVKLRQERMQGLVDALVVNRSNSLRRIVFGFHNSKMSHTLDSQPNPLARKWERAQETIELLEKLYGVILIQCISAGLNGWFQDGSVVLGLRPTKSSFELRLLVHGIHFKGVPIRRHYLLIPPPPPAALTMLQPSDDTAARAEVPLDMTRLLSTNYPLDDVEKHVVQGKIDMLESSIQRVRAQLEELENQLLLCKIVLSPMRKVPQEIIGVIFKFTLEALADPKARAVDLLRLALVCKAWNDEAHNSAHWSNIFIPVYKCNPQFATSKEMAARFKDLRMIKVQEFAMCECLRSTTQGVNTCPLSKSACFQLLSCSRNSSLQSISLSVSCFQCFDKFMQSVKNGKEALQTWLSIRSVTLEIFKYRQLQSTTGREDFNLKDLPPSLTSLTLSLPKLSRVTTRLRLLLSTSMLGKLTFLGFGCGWNTLITLDILRCCKNLQHLRLEYLMWPQTLSEDAAEVVLPKLRTLDVSMTPSASATILPLLILPALVDIRIGAIHGGEAYDKLAYLNIFSPGTPSAPTLLSLTIYFNRLAEDDALYTRDSEQGLVDTFFAIPSLQDFTLMGTCFDSQRFLEILQRRVEQGDKVFLPKIQSFQLINPNLNLRSQFDVKSSSNS